MKLSPNKTFARIAVALLYCACAIIVFGQKGGFNDIWGRKLEAKLKRKHPPEYFIIGTAVRLEIRTQIPAGNDYVGLLRERLQSGLFAKDSRLQSEERNPQTIISCQITRIDADDNRWDQVTTTESQKTGERQEWNQKKGKYDTKAVYTDVKVTRRYKIVKGGIHISYHTKDKKTGATLDAENIQANFDDKYLDGNGALMKQEVYERLVNSAVEQLVKRLTPTVETLVVNLPRGKVEDFSKFGHAGLWEKMREGVDKMGAFPKPADEAYRQFALGIANEALGYDAPRVEDSIKLFEEAGINYDKALELKRDEKYFLSPITRLRDSLEKYKKLAGQIVEYEKSKSPSKPQAESRDSGEKGGGTNPRAQVPLPQPQSQPTPSTAPQALTNQKVIEMVKAEFDDANIIDTINKAPAVQFDLSFEGKMQLKGNKVSNSVITAMTQKQNKQSASPRRSSPTTRRKVDP